MEKVLVTDDTFDGDSGLFTILRLLSSFIKEAHRASFKLITYIYIKDSGRLSDWGYCFFYSEAYEAIINHITDINNLDIYDFNFRDICYK